MNRQEVIKQAYIEAWNGYREALKVVDERGYHTEQDTLFRDFIVHLPQLSPMAAQIYRQLTALIHVEVPVGITRDNIEILAHIFDELELNYIILPDGIKLTNMEDDEPEGVTNEANNTTSNNASRDDQ